MIDTKRPPAPFNPDDCKECRRAKKLVRGAPSIPSHVLLFLVANGFGYYTHSIQMPIIQRVEIAVAVIFAWLLVALTARALFSPGYLVFEQRDAVHLHRNKPWGSMTHGYRLSLLAGEDTWVRTPDWPTLCILRGRLLPGGRTFVYWRSFRSSEWVVSQLTFRAGTPRVLVSQRSIPTDEAIDLQLAEVAEHICANDQLVGNFKRFVASCTGFSKDAKVQESRISELRTQLADVREQLATREQEVESQRTALHHLFRSISNAIDNILGSRGRSQDNPLREWGSAGTIRTKGLIPMLTGGLAQPYALKWSEETGIALPGASTAARANAA